MKSAHRRNRRTYDPKKQQEIKLPQLFSLDAYIKLPQHYEDDDFFDPNWHISVGGTGGQGDNSSDSTSNQLLGQLPLSTITHPPEPEIELVQGEKGEKGETITHPPEPEIELVQGEKGETGAGGWLERYIKNKKLKSGSIATYPRVEGVRDPNNPEHWFWSYRYEEKSEKAKSNNGCITRTIYLPRNQVQAVSNCIECGWKVDRILQFIFNSQKTPDLSVG